MALDTLRTQMSVIIAVLVGLLACAVAMPQAPGPVMLVEFTFENGFTNTAAGWPGTPGLPVPTEPGTIVARSDDPTNHALSMQTYTPDGIAFNVKESFPPNNIDDGHYGCDCSLTDWWIKDAAYVAMVAIGSVLGTAGLLWWWNLADPSARPDYDHVESTDPAGLVTYDDGEYGLQAAVRARGCNGACTSYFGSGATLFGVGVFLVSAAVHWLRPTGTKDPESEAFSDWTESLGWMDTGVSGPRDVPAKRAPGGPLLRCARRAGDAVRCASPLVVLALVPQLCDLQIRRLRRRCLVHGVCSPHVLCTVPRPHGSGQNEAFSGYR